MASISKTYDAIIAMLDSMVHNPSRRFVTASDLLQYANAAAIEVAMDIGGIDFIDTTNTSTAQTRDYTPSNQYFAITKAQYIQNIGVLATETTTPLDIISETSREFLASVSMTGQTPDNSSLYIAGSAQVIPKYLIWNVELGTFRIVETPSVTGDTFKLWVRGVPAALSSGVDYSGSVLEVLAIVYKMASIARMKSRETGESGVFDQKYQDQISKILRVRSKRKQIRTVQDGRFIRTRLRSVNGAL